MQFRIQPNGSRLNAIERRWRPWVYKVSLHHNVSFLDRVSNQSRPNYYVRMQAARW